METSSLETQSASQFGRARHSGVRKVAMKRCALCHGKLGLGARFRNIWNGRWWAHVRFCSVRCESIYEVKRNDVAKHRWYAFLARGNSRTLGNICPTAQAITNEVSRDFATRSVRR